MRRRLDERSTPNALSSGLTVQVRAVHALVVREMMMRYGRANIGFLWVVLEPMLLTSGVLILWSALKAPYEHGVQVISLVMTGYMPLTLWRHITQAGVHAFRRSMSLLYHRHITLFDAFIARMILEFAGTTTALVIVYLVLLAAGLVSPVHNPGIVVLGWLSMAALSVGVAACIAVLTEYSEASEKFIQPFQYFMLPLSGSFFMVEWLPYKVQQIALMNPSVHCYEMVRGGLFGEEVVTHYTVWYPALFGVVLFALGIARFDAVRDRLHTG